MSRSDGKDQGYLAPHQPHCLGCGDQNPASMGLRLRIDGDHVRGEVTLDRRHEGAPGFAHGGAVATILDDALGTTLVILKRPAVTAKLEIDYRQPAFLGRPFDVEAWVESVDGRKINLAGELRDGDAIIAQAHGLFLEVAIEHFLKGGQELPAGWRGRGEGAFQLPW